tara:strand:- start:24153 stop:24473 length:321 start_codon:yes stop_codon:yes gene_type:complete
MIVKPGDKVVCIHAEWVKGSRQLFFGLASPLVAGEVYTVTGIEIWSPSSLTDKYGTRCLVLDEATNTTATPFVGFGERRFRKLIDISQGMEQLKAIARNPTKGIEV